MEVDKKKCSRKRVTFIHFGSNNNFYLCYNTGIQTDDLDSNMSNKQFHFQVLAKIRCPRIKIWGFTCYISFTTTTKISFYKKLL